MKNIIKIIVTFGIISIIFISILGFTKQQTVFTENKHQIDRKMLNKAFEASNADLVGTNMNFWAEIKDKDYSLEEMKEIVHEFAEILDIEKQSNIKTEEYKEGKKVVTTIEKESKMIITIIMEGCILQNGNTNTYLLMDISLNHEYQGIEELEEKIIHLFSEQDMDYDYSMTLIGNFEKNMNTDIMREVIDKSFEEVEAKEIEGMVEDEYSQMVSLSGYSPHIHRSIQLSGNKININTAMRYSEYDDSTYIWIGVPMIATEY